MTEKVITLPKWVDKYLKEGISARDFLTKEDVVVIQAMRNKYTSIYYNFFSELQGRKRLKGVPGFQNKLSEASASVSEIVDILSKVLGERGRYANKEELSRLFQLMVEVDYFINMLSDIAEQNTSFGKDVEQLESRSGFSLKNLKENQKRFTKRFRKLGPTGTQRLSRGYKALEKGFPAAGLGREMLTSVTEQVLGPFTGLGKILGKTTLGAGKFITEAYRRGKRTRLSNILGEFGRVELERMERQTGLRKKGVSLVPPLSRLFRRKEVQPSVEVPTEFRAPFIEHPGVMRFPRRIGEGTEKGFSFALFDFFNTRAYRAKWTKEILDVLKEKKLAKDMGTISLFDRLLPVAAFLGKAGLFTGTGIMSYKLGKQLDKMTGISEKLGGWLGNLWSSITQRKKRKITEAMESGVIKEYISKGKRAKIIRQQREKFGWSALAGDMPVTKDTNGFNNTKNSGVTEKEGITKTSRKVTSVVKTQIKKVPVNVDVNQDQVIFSLDNIGRILSKQETFFKELINKISKIGDKTDFGTSPDTGARDIGDTLTQSVSSGKLATED